MIHLGKIAFTNCDFPYYAMEHGKISLHDINIVEAHPVKLANMLADKKLDISPISSIMCTKIDNLLILPHMSITSNDFTKSVLVCSNGKIDLSDLDGKTMCIPETTASSATLVKIILWLKNINVDMIQCEGTDIDDMLKKGDSALLIGDSAIHAIGKYNIIADLGNEWKKITGKKMVYALWVVREDFVKSHHDDVIYVINKILQSKEYAYKNIIEISKYISHKKKIDHEFIKDYFHTLNYELDKESIDSIELFFRYAKECGLIDNDKIRFFEYK